jgi:hypothetical protein
VADTELVEVELPDGGRILVRAKQFGSVKGPADIALSDILSFATVSEALCGMASGLRDAIKAVQPDVAEVEFGLDLAVKGSRLACLLVDGGATASIRVRLEWDKSKAHLGSA